MKEKILIDGAEYISLEEAKRLKLPYFENVAAGFPSPAADYQHESLDLNEKPVVVLSNNDGCVVARSNEAKAKRASLRIVSSMTSGVRAIRLDGVIYQRQHSVI
jgi:hypothetical protein